MEIIALILTMNELNGLFEYSWRMLYLKGSGTAVRIYTVSDTRDGKVGIHLSLLISLHEHSISTRTFVRVEK